MTAPSQPVVKICGITNEADARLAIESGADALGFNLWSGSKRHVKLDEILPWLDTLPASMTKVAVVVNPTVDEIRAARPHFDILQLHGQESPDLCAEAAQPPAGSSGSARLKVWKALPMSARIDPSPYMVDAILIDAAVPGSFGGTGSLIDLNLAADFVRASVDREIWLSGGLNPGNLAKAIATVRPHGVDVASGVEMPGNPRRKDRERLAAFISAARNAGEDQG